MIRLFYGDDRKAAEIAIKKALGANFEVLEGVNLDVAELPSIFLGGTLFASERALLIKDLGENKAVLGEMAKYLETPHNVVIWESKLDKRTAFYKDVKDKIEIREFAMPKQNNFNLTKDIYNTAKRDGAKALKMLEPIMEETDPYMFFGSIASFAIADYTAKQGTKEKRVLKELSKLDIDMKSSTIQPWLLMQSFLLRLSSLA